MQKKKKAPFYKGLFFCTVMKESFILRARGRLLKNI